MGFTSICGTMHGVPTIVSCATGQFPKHLAAFWTLPERLVAFWGTAFFYPFIEEDKNILYEFEVAWK
eukprot:COSAG02_NODE_269_length_26468_cov_4.489021_7_plen_67_part_00